jgi:L-threonylcarbamoyladenylate synthase
MHDIKLSMAVRALQGGEVIVYPTDTLYALGVDIYNEMAVRKVFAIKERPFRVPLLVAVSSYEDLTTIAVANDSIQRLVESFLPGPLALVVKKKSVVPDILTSGLKKIAVRIPDNDVALALLSRCGPLTATSANIHGRPTPSNVAGIRREFNPGDISVFLDYGELQGLPSTIIDLTLAEPVILREGIIAEKDILRVISDGR